MFGGAPLPVTLTASAMLLPRKSISGVFGVVPAPGVPGADGGRPAAAP